MMQEPLAVHHHSNEPLAVKVSRNVIYGAGGINYTGRRQERALAMDVYEPAQSRKSARPAIILAFGGAFHRGSKDDDTFTVGDGTNTPTAWYANYWAQQGYVTFCIDYRLIPEDPDPGNTPALSGEGTVGSERMHTVRANLGLPPLSDALLSNGVEAGSDDMAAAARFVYANASRWNVDIGRVALWGWSAGARNALNAVFAEGVPACAIIALSAYVHDASVRRLLSKPRGTPALLLVSAERDLPHIRQQAEPMADLFTHYLRQVEHLVLEDIDHFYPASSRVRGGGASSTLLTAMSEFLERTIGPPQPTTL
jgi:acetyl esterase/lipase